MPIYNDSLISINNTRLYKQMLKDRGVLSIKQFRTKYFSEIDTSTIPSTEHIWQKNDKLIRLSNRFYNTKDYWWIIGYFNQKPTDAHYEVGDVVYIPPAYLFNTL
jgi:hypothetical protein|tara:strand:- start:5013 stop:5327 length:315 start_codon:yes stop_codon:yes gene_type:complete